MELVAESPLVLEIILGLVALLIFAGALFKLRSSSSRK